MMTNGIKITVEETGYSVHTLDDLSLALQNNDYIGQPELETAYIDVPYRAGLIDASESIAGRPIYKKRQLKFILGGMRDRVNWDHVISTIRNNIHGRVCRLTIDNDIDHFWKGRVYVNDFDRFRELGTFTLIVPTADPYKYNLQASDEEWLWDPFNFETGVIQEFTQISVNGTYTKTIDAGTMPTTPQFICEDVTSLTVENKGRTKTLSNGVNRFPEILVNGDTDEVLTFRGRGKVTIRFRGGSL